MDALCTLGKVRRKQCDVGWDSVVVRCVAGEHRARAHADSARRHQYLLSSSDATAFAMALHVDRRHELLTVGDEPEHVMLRYPAHARPIQVVAVKVLIDIEGDVAVFDLFKHVPLEEIANRARGMTMIIQPAREHQQSELRGVGFKAFDITDAKPVGLMGEETLEIPLQYLDALLQ